MIDDETRKLDIAQIVAIEYARKPGVACHVETFGKDVARVFKDVYEALGCPTEPKKYYDNSDQEEVLEKIRNPYSGFRPSSPDYAKVQTKLKQDTDAALKDLEAEKVAKYNEKVKASEEKIAKQLSSYEPKWTDHPTRNGVYFIDCPFNSMQARWVLVCLGYVSWFGDARSIHYTSSGITRFYGPMKAPE